MSGVPGIIITRKGLVAYVCPLIPPLPVYTDILPCIRAQRTVPRLNLLGAILIREFSLPHSIAPLLNMVPILVFLTK